MYNVPQKLDKKLRWKNRKLTKNKGEKKCPVRGKIFLTNIRQKLP